MGVLVTLAECVALGLAAPHVETQCVPVNAPPLGQVYTRDAGCVMTQLDPDTVPPFAQEEPVTSAFRMHLDPLNV